MIEDYITLQIQGEALVFRGSPDHSAHALHEVRDGGSHDEKGEADDC